MSARPLLGAQEQEIPEVDRVAGFPHPREASFLFGHEDAESEFIEGWKAGRLHHAWLLAGSEGIGKATLAYRFARFLLANRNPYGAREATGIAIDPAASVFRQVASQAHPDLMVLRRPWQRQNKRHAQAITVDEARRLRGFLGQTASGGGWRVVIVDAADDLNIAAANALLKSLEEPPAYCLFLLVAARPGRLAVTIRSRCRTLRMKPLGEDDMRLACDTAFKASEQSEPSPDVMQRILSLAGGSPGTALRLIAGDGAALHGQLAELMGQLPGLNYEQLHKLADSLAPVSANERYAMFHGLLAEMIARLISASASGTSADAEEAKLAQRLIPPGALARWVGVWETLHREKAEADALNLDRKILILETFFRLERVARGEVD